MTAMIAHSCAVGPCQAPRAAGSDYCSKHGPKAGPAGSWTRAADRERRLPAAATPTGQRAIICPHCGTQGSVTMQPAKRKRGISGGKATGALLTAGWSVLATGLSRKQAVTECRCGVCGMTWTVER